MKQKFETIFDKDLDNNQLYIIRDFKTPVKSVWRAWTESDLLNQPYKEVTKTMNFVVGGMWFCYMLSPKGDQHWCRYDFEDIKKK